MDFHTDDNHLPAHLLEIYPSRQEEKGKDRELPSQTLSEEDQLRLDLGVSKVMDILPDYPESYIRDLLRLPEYIGVDDAERVIADLLEGAAPSPETATQALVQVESLPETKIEVEVEVKVEKNTKGAMNGVKKHGTVRIYLKENGPLFHVLDD